jgi:hypothetical protein
MRMPKQFGALLKAVLLSIIGSIVILSEEPVLQLLKKPSLSQVVMMLLLTPKYN